MAGKWIVVAGFRPATLHQTCNSINHKEHRPYSVLNREEAVMGLKERKTRKQPANVASTTHKGEKGRKNNHN